MTNEEKAELQALKEKIRGWNAYHIGRPVNGEEVSIREVKNLRRLSFLLGKEEESKRDFFRGFLENLAKHEKEPEPKVITLCEEAAVKKGMEIQKEEDKEAIQVRENLYSADPDVVLKQISHALSRGPLTFTNIKILVKNLIREFPHTIRIVLDELKFEENSDFEEGVEAAFRNFIDQPETDEGDIVKLTNKLIGIAFSNISEEGEKEIVKHAVEEMV